MLIFTSVITTKTNIMKTFTTENQKGNNITTTTVQTLKHAIYSNIEVSISGRWNTKNECSVWVNTGSRMTQKFSNLTLDQAIVEANKLVREI
jgi:hypothetical protein